MATAAPIALIVFNRPDHTQRVLEALKANKMADQTILHIFADGSRGPKDDAGVQKVRELIRKADGFKEVVLHESPVNKGCSVSVLSSIEYVLTLSDRCIVVEDDILTAPNFLEYMNAALEYYQDCETIFSIGAYRSEFKMPSSYTEEVYLLSRSCAWGWGTWKRAWDKISVDPQAIKQDLNNPQIRKAFAEHGEDWLRTFDEDPEIWDLRVSYGIWKSGMATVMPAQSYTQNIGRDGSGLHYHGEALKTNQITQFPASLPRFVPLNSIDENVRKAFKRFSHKPLWRVYSTQIAKKLGIYKLLLTQWEKLGLS